MVPEGMEPNQLEALYQGPGSPNREDTIPIHSAETSYQDRWEEFLSQLPSAHLVRSGEVSLAQAIREYLDLENSATNDSPDESLEGSVGLVAAIY